MPLPLLNKSTSELPWADQILLCPRRRIRYDRTKADISAIEVSADS
jgi:hypothetical protein